MKAIKMFFAIVGTVAVLATSTLSAQVREKIPGCDGRTNGFSTTTGQSCAGNVVFEPEIKITSKVGPVYRDGQDIVVSWESSNFPKNAFVSIRLIIPGQDMWGYNIGSRDGNPISGSIRFKARVLSQKIERYQVQVILYERVEVDHGYYYSPLAQAVSRTVAIHLVGKKRSVKFTSSNNVTVVAGSPLWVTWKSINLPANARIVLNARPLNPVEGEGHSYFYQEVENTGGYQWQVPDDFISGTYTLVLSYRNEYGLDGAPPVENSFVVVTEK